MVDQGGRAVAELRGIVPRHLPQTSQAAEYLAVGNSLGHLRREATYYEDCLGVHRNVVALMQNHDHWRGKGCYHAVLRGLARNRRLHLLSRFVKVKAHVDADSCSDDAERFLATGNDLADKGAKAAVALHPGIPEECRQQASRAVKVARGVLKLAAVLLRQWPKAEKLEKAARPPDPTPPPDAAVGLEVGSEDEVPAPRRAQGGRALVVPECLEPMCSNDRGHHLAVFHTTPPSGLVVCMRCASWATSRLSARLKLGCLGAPSIGGAAALSRLAKGRHPDPAKKNVLVGSCVSLRDLATG